MMILMLMLVMEIYITRNKRHGLRNFEKKENIRNYSPERKNEKLIF